MVSARLPKSPPKAVQPQRTPGTPIKTAIKPVEMSQTNMIYEYFNDDEPTVKPSILVSPEKAENIVQYKGSMNSAEKFKVRKTL